MKLELTGSSEVSAPRELLWQRLIDPRSVAQSAPGIESVEVLDPTHFRVMSGFGIGRMRARVTLEGELFDLIPDTSARMRMRGTGAGSAIDVLSTMAIKETGTLRKRSADGCYESTTSSSRSGLPVGVRSTRPRCTAASEDARASASSSTDGWVVVTAITRMPALRAAWMPAGASSTTRHPLGGRSSFAAAIRYTSGAGFPRSTSSAQIRTPGNGRPAARSLPVAVFRVPDVATAQLPFGRFRSRRAAPSIGSMSTGIGAIGDEGCDLRISVEVGRGQPDGLQGAPAMTHA